MLEKVGRSLESKDPECTILMLEMAAETVETENRPFQAACYTSRLLKLVIKRCFIIQIRSTIFETFKKYKVVPNIVCNNIISELHWKEITTLRQLTGLAN